MKIDSKGIGKVITFYSFKGGVGRTMALANVATLLSKWDKKILIVDFDLEAPGVEKYFNGPDFKFSKKREDCFGIIDLLTSISDNDTKIKWKDCLMNASSVINNLQCDILPAGKDNAEYATKLQNLNWDFLFVERNFSEKLEQIRNEWKETYEFILIDSRTGISDIGGICTIYLPDIIAFLFTTNEASLSGCIDVIDRVKESRSKLPYDRNSLIAIPIPSRDESKSEYESAMKWKEVFIKRLEHLYRDWLPKDTSVKSAIDVLKIPYIPYWSFGDRLPVIEEGTSENSIGYAFEKIAMLILADFDWQKVKSGFSTDDIEASQKLLLEQERHKIESEFEKQIVREAQFANQKKKLRLQRISTIAFVTISLLTIVFFKLVQPWMQKTDFEKFVKVNIELNNAVQNAGGLDSLSTLNINESNYAILNGNLKHFENLKAISITQTNNLIDLSIFNNIKNPSLLDSLAIVDNDLLTSLEGIEKLTALSSLIISENNSLTSIEGIENLISLNSLTITRNSALLKLVGREKSKFLKILYQLTHLEKLSIDEKNGLDFGRIRKNNPGIKIVPIESINLKPIPNEFN